MLTLLLSMVAAGWMDLPPRPTSLPLPASRLLTREELLERRRVNRAERRRKRRAVRYALP